MYLTKSGNSYTDTRETGNLLEIVHAIPVNRGPAGFFINQWRYYRALFSICGEISRKRGKFSLIHAQVAWKSGFDAFLISISHRLKYIVTEHNTGYLPEDRTLTGWKRRMCYFVLNRAAVVSAVSDKLAGAIGKLKNKIAVIPNSIHPSFFKVPVNSTNQEFTFLHVSNFRNRHKQTEVIIREFSEFSKTHHRCRLNLVVPEDAYNEFQKQNPDVNLTRVTLLPVSEEREKLASFMSASDCLISYSKFETFGLTIAEALCCGVPVICTPCGGADLYIDERMGIVCDPDKPETLGAAMEEAMVVNRFDKAGIAEKSRKMFDNSRVLNEYLKLYNQIVS